jgi:ABC-type lipopolysaccharide export system ATPase subunit
VEGLIAQGLRKRFRSRVVVNRVSLDIHPGEVVGLLGPNGAGKTTSFYMIVGLLRPDGGRIFLEGEDVTELPMYLLPPRHGVPAAGVLGVPEADRRGEPARDPRDPDLAPRA